MSQSDSLDAIPVMKLNPLWRWAVIPLSLVGEPEGAALPFVRRRAAVRWARNLPECCPMMLLRRRGWRTYDLAGQIR